MNHPRRGMAIPLALVLLLTLTLLGHGLLLLSRREVRAAAALRDLAVAERSAIVGLQQRWVATRGPGSATTPRDWEPEASGSLNGGVRYDVSRLWLDHEFFLLKAFGQVPGRAGGRRVVWFGQIEGCAGQSMANPP